MTTPPLTREQILAMPAGYKLDTLIEQHVFGRTVVWSEDYSTDIRMAWQVVEKIARQGTLLSIAVGPYGDQGVKTSVMFFGMDGGVVEDSAPLAICRAALLAQLWQQESFPP
jgi:hypothetical protein